MVNEYSPGGENEQRLFLGIVIGVAVILGVVVRYQYLAHTTFPINDGGYFYQMTKDLLENQFELPIFTRYNLAKIPYAYPPFAFYVTGAVHKLLGIPLLSLFRHIPFLLSIFTLPVFYAFTKIFIEEKLIRVVALFLFAMLPRSFEWFVMGGGITRTFGFIFALLATIYSSQLFRSERFHAWYLLASAVFSTLTFLSHPVTSVFLVYSIFLLFVFSERKVDNLRKAAALLVAVVLLTLPWWGTVISRHGISPFLGAGSTGHSNWFELENFITLRFGFENPYFLSVYGMLALLAAFSSQRRVILHLLVAVLGGYIVMPRGGVDLLSSYLAVFAALGLDEILLHLSSTESTRDEGQGFVQIRSMRSKAFLLFIFLYLFVGAYTYKYVEGKQDLHMTASDVLAMSWIQEHTDEDADFLLFPSRGEGRFWWNDFRAEWFPALTNRKNVTTVQGYEWKHGAFAQRVSAYINLYFCSMNEVSCIENWENDNGVDVDYVYIGDRRERKKIIEDFHDHEDFDVVYTNKESIIFRRTSQE